jgi:hypothetical protein
MDSPPIPLQYNFSIVSFFDVLGFRQIVETKEPEEIERILTLFDYNSNPRTRYDTGPGADLSHSAADETGLIYTGFSDLGVRSVNVRSEENLAASYGVLFHEILDLTHIQIELVAKSILIRGGLTVGEIAHTDEMVFGPAMNRAYKIESELAVYPIILIDQVALDSLSLPEMRPYDRTEEQERPYINNLIAPLDDGRSFIDYLHSAADEIDDNERYIRFLRHHQQLIESALGQTQSPSVTSKYFWLARYHNRVVSDYYGGLRDLDEDPDSYYIFQNSLPPLPPRSSV